MNRWTKDELRRHCNLAILVGITGAFVSYLLYKAWQGFGPHVDNPEDRATYLMGVWAFWVAGVLCLLVSLLGVIGQLKLHRRQISRGRLSSRPG